jgi:hypothetical protein
MSTPEPPAPTGPPPTPGVTPDPQKRREFLTGLGLGLIPGLLAIITIDGDFGYGYVRFFFLRFFGGASLFTVLIVSLGSWLVALVAWIVLVSIPRTRRIGLGMLTAWAIDPVFTFIGCLVILSRGPVP